MECRAKTDGTYLVVVAPHDVNIRRYSLQVLVGLPIAQVTSTKNLLDLSWDEKLLEFCWQIVDAMWYVEVANNENKNHGSVV